MPTPDRPEPRFAVSVDEHLLEADLAHATAAGRAAIAPVIDELENTGIPKSRLKRCQPEGRDGTRLAGCVKIYIQHPDGPWGAVLTGGKIATVPTLVLLAAGSAPSGAAVDTQRLPGRPQTTAGDRRAGPAGQEPRRSQLNDHGWAARLSHTPRAGERFRAKFWRRCPGNVGDLLRGREVLGPNRAFRRRGWLSWSACSIWSDLSTHGARSSSGTGMGRRGRTGRRGRSLKTE